MTEFGYNEPPKSRIINLLHNTAMLFGLFILLIAGAIAFVWLMLTERKW